MRIEIPDNAAWQTLAQQLRDHGGAAARVPPSELPQPFQDVEVVFSGPAGELAREVGQVVQMSPDGQIYVVFPDPAKQRLLAVVSEDASGSDEGASADAAGSGRSADDKPLWLKYTELSKAEKIKLARQGNNEARRLVLKDKDQALHLHLLQNPGLNANEAATLIRAGGAGAGFIKRFVTQRNNLLGNQRVVEAIVTNPLTPMPIALQLVGRLQIDIVRRIARSGNLRTPIVKAARKRVIQK